MGKDTSHGIVTFGPEGETDRRKDMVELLRNCPIPDDELMMNLGLFLTPQTLSRVLFMDFMYQKILEVQGVVMEFGCRWGQSTSLFTSLRGIYEPFNRLRKVVAFDSFDGFPDVSDQDGTEMVKGGYATSEGYQDYLAQVLAFQEQESPLEHLKKHEVVPGDITKTLPEYLKDNPETIIALAYFDLDIYEPTLDSLKSIGNHITRGTVLGFDELNDHAAPGETVALREALGLDKYAVRRYRYNARTSYLVIE